MKNRVSNAKSGSNLLVITLLLLFLNSFLPSAYGKTRGGASTILSTMPDVRESGKLMLQDEFDRLEQFEITAPQLRIPTRTIQVYLPPDYYTSDKKYPVIYLHDGGLLFNPAQRDCLYDETLDRLFAEGETEGIIAVGIFSSQNRWDEYSPWINDNMHDWIVPAKAGSTEGGEGEGGRDGESGDRFHDVFLQVCTVLKRRVVTMHPPSYRQISVRPVARFD